MARSRIVGLLRRRKQLMQELIEFNTPVRYQSRVAIADDPRETVEYQGYANQVNLVSTERFGQPCSGLLGIQFQSTPTSAARSETI